jgi:hypothetical protein
LESKKTKKITNKDDFEKSKGIIEDVENTKDEALQSVVPKVKKEQMPRGDEMTKEILDGEYNNNNNNNNLKRPQLNTKKEKTISSKISKFAKGFRIPNDKNKKNSNKI